MTTQKKGDTPSKKFEQLAHYILWYLKEDGQNNFLWIKLNTALWFFDVWEYSSTCKPISGEQFYLKKGYHVEPLGIDSILKKLEKKGLIKRHAKTEEIDLNKIEITDPRESKLQEFDDSKLAEVNLFCKKLKSADSKVLKGYFNHGVYTSRKNGEKIPLTAYFLTNEKKPTEEDIKWAKKSYARYLLLEEEKKLSEKIKQMKETDELFREFCKLHLLLKQAYLLSKETKPTEEDIKWAKKSYLKYSKQSKPTKKIISGMQNESNATLTALTALTL